MLFRSPWLVGDRLQEFRQQSSQSPQALPRSFELEVGALVKVYEYSLTPEWRTVSQRLATRRKVFVAGFQTERGIAASMVHLLQYLRDGVQLVDGAAGHYADVLLSVPADAREKLYAEIPQLQCLQYWLEEDPQLQNDFRDPELDDYRAGSFYWAIRRAAQYEGIYADAATADAYWQSVADAINAACDNGTLPARSGRRSATSQPIRAQYVLPAIREAAKSALWALTFQDCPAYYQTLRSIGTTEDVAQWSAYLHCNFNNAAEAGKDTPYYAPLQKLAYRALGVLRCVYAVLLPLAFVWAVVRHLCALPMVLRRRTAGAALPWLLLFGLLAMAALRCGMIAFVEVSSFGIGTSTMYLSTVHPLLLLYTYGCLICYRNKGVITE